MEVYIWIKKRASIPLAPCISFRLAQLIATVNTNYEDIANHVSFLTRITNVEPGHLSIL
jgi:hypothetical protein